MLTAALTHSGDIILGMRACTFLTMFTALSVAEASLPINKAGQSPWAQGVWDPNCVKNFTQKGRCFVEKVNFLVIARTEAESDIYMIALLYWARPGRGPQP